jgi:thiamine biosynthesis lipoprotein ApbE
MLIEIPHSLNLVTVINTETMPVNSLKTLLSLSPEAQQALLKNTAEEVLASSIAEINEGNTYALLKVVK